MVICSNFFRATEILKSVCTFANEMTKSRVVFFETPCILAVSFKRRHGRFTFLVSSLIFLFGSVRQTKLATRQLLGAR